MIENRRLGQGGELHSGVKCRLAKIGIANRVNHLPMRRQRQCRIVKFRDDHGDAIDLIIEKGANRDIAYHCRDQKKQGDGLRTSAIGHRNGAAALKRQTLVRFAGFFIAQSPKEVAQALMRFLETGGNPERFLEIFACQNQVPAVQERIGEIDMPDGIFWVARRRFGVACAGGRPELQYRSAPRLLSAPKCNGESVKSSK